MTKNFLNLGRLNRMDTTDLWCLIRPDILSPGPLALPLPTPLALPLVVQ